MASIPEIFLIKILATLRRLIDLVRLFPLRLIRVVGHVQTSFARLDAQTRQTMGRRYWWASARRWWTDLFFLLLDLFGVADFYELLADWVKFNTRSLFDWEKKVAVSVFGCSIQYHRVRIDERALLGPRQYQLCYVSGNTINAWGGMHNSLLIHELMHVWQYQHVGLAYIPRALRAQFSRAGYNYGGVDQLRRYRTDRKTLFAFNFEQQADIVADYYRLREGYPPRWGQASGSDLPVYEYFIRFLQTPPLNL